MPVPLLVGAVFILICVHMLSEQLRTAILAINPSTASGILVDKEQTEAEGTRGAVVRGDRGIYLFTVNGTEYLATTDAGKGDLKRRVTVEYSPANPSLARVQGDGAQSILGVLIRVSFWLGLIVAVLAWWYEGYKATAPRKSMLELLYPPGSPQRAELEQRSQPRE